MNSNSTIESLINLFSGIVDNDEDIPKAFLMFQEARQAYLEGDLKRANIIKRLIKIIHNCEIPFTAEIGKNAIFAYGGIGVIIHGSAIIGERCNIGSNVTIGGTERGTPVIGHDVYIATGAKVLGDVLIGDGAIVGANAVVLKSVPRFTVYAGVPAKHIASIDRDSFHKYSSYYWCKNDLQGQKKFQDWYFRGEA